MGEGTSQVTWESSEEHQRILDQIALMGAELHRHVTEDHAQLLNADQIAEREAIMVGKIETTLSRHQDLLDDVADALKGPRDRLGGFRIEEAGMEARVARVEQQFQDFIQEWRAERDKRSRVHLGPAERAAIYVAAISAFASIAVVIAQSTPSP